MRIRPTSDRFWWIIAVGYLAVFAVLYVPDLQNAPLERFLNALLLGGPALILALKLRQSPRGVRVTLYGGFLALAVGLALDVASSAPGLTGLPLVSPTGTSRSASSAALNLGFFLVLVSCIQLLELALREQAELVRSREEARLSSQQYRELFAGMRDAVFESETSGQFVSVNPAGLALLGYDTLEEILRIDIPTELYVDPEDRIGLHEQVEKTGFVKDFEVRLRRRDDSVIHALVNSTASYGADGRISSYRGTIRDVTDQRLAEAEIARLQEMNRNVIESLPHGLLVVDVDLRTVQCNRGLERITGVPRDRLLGCRPWESLPSLTGLRDRIERALGGETVTRDRVRITRADGAGGYLADTYSPLRDARARIVGVIGFVEEVTERMLLEQQLIQAEKVAAIGQMVSGVAHEINNPLTAVSGYAQLLLASDCSDVVKEDVAKISESAERCGQIVRGLLTYGRKHEHRMTSVDPIDVLEAAHELQAYELAMDDIVIHREYEPNLPFVRGDLYQLQQVVLNLVHNAADAIRDTGHGGTIRLQARQAGEQVVLGVENTGDPIDEDLIRRVFDPFFTTKDVGRGTGLGLSVAQNIVRNHGGAITVKNRAEGVRFEVELPGVTTPPDAVEPGSEDESTEVEIHLKRARILIIDDEVSIQDLFVSALPDAEVVVAPDGRTALVRLEAEHWDAIITDVKMPGGISGLDVLEWVREQRPAFVSRMVLMTGASFEPSLRSDLLPDGIPLLLKPFGLNELRSCVADAVAHSEPLPVA